MPRIYKSVIFEENKEKNGVSILSPDVGIYYKPPELGGFMKTNSIVGILKRLHSIYHLRIPEGVSGFVHHVSVKNIANPVEYKQELFFLVSGQNVDIAAIEKTETLLVGDQESQAPPGALAITSPTDGIFYRRPNPESPPYVEEDMLVSQGEVLGLVEVMKSFNQIKYSGPDFPLKAKVIKILLPDAAEVRSGQVIFWLEPQ
ncbi:hypothetical protein ACFL27_25620 [candidate division CSSED10-310 bacterium]|uniref:Biotin carboxyl carrier protein of acetyl-CoA carboxylase n=1 Tax=candidate division CSSED10-310 bacterium TaxID=2855610 RepID=A0ABV6Z555_UNCC1